MVGNRHRAVSMAFNACVTPDEKEESLQSLAELKAVFKDIRYDWPQLIQGEVTPIELAISFLDDTSVGLAHRKAEFDELCQSTAEALRSAVVKNHQAFNNSIGLYHQLLSMARTSQADSMEVKNLIDTSSKDVRGRSSVLKELDQSCAKYSEMIEVLDAMEYLREIPSTIDNLIAEKKIHQVYDVISEGYKTALKYNLWSLSSMNATQSYLEMQSNNLYDMIVDELHNEIYLKNALSIKDSWINMIHSNSPQITSYKTLISQLTTLEQYIYNSANLEIHELADVLSEAARNFLQAQLPDLHRHYFNSSKPKVNYALLLDSTLNPASGSYFYIYMLISTAAKLNKLDSVSEILFNSLQLELQAMINQTTAECKLLNLHRLARIAKAKTLESKAGPDEISGSSFHDTSVPILLDFFGSFFLKCLVILLKHKIACEVINLVNSTNDLSAKRGLVSDISRPDYNFEAVWAGMQREIDNLLINYIYEEQDDTITRKSDLGASKIHQVLSQKMLFRIDDAASSSTKQSSDELRITLNDMFPGFLLEAQKASSITGNDNSAYISNERFASLIEVLVPKNIFNMRIILEFFLLFVAGSTNLFNNFDKSVSTNLAAQNYFQVVMERIFLTKLRAQIDEAFTNCMISDNVVELSNGNSNTSLHFKQTTVNLGDCESQPDTQLLTKQQNGAQIYLNAFQFKTLFSNVCFTMNTSFSYRQSISDVVLELLRKFGNSYHSYYQHLLVTGSSQSIPEMNVALNGDRSLRIQEWMRLTPLTSLSGSLMLNIANREEAQRLVSKEIDLMFHLRNSDVNIMEISKDDMLDDELFEHICTLLVTASWVLSWLPSMRKQSNFESKAGTNGFSSLVDVNKLRLDFTFLENGRAASLTGEKTSNIFLTLNLAAIEQFDQVVRIFESIRDKSLIALRYDLRLKAMYHISQSYRDNFVLTTEPADSDPFITSFNKKVYFVGTRVGEILNPFEQQCIFFGLPEFIDHAFLQGSESVNVINRNGIKRIILNIFTSQQMLRSVMRKEDNVDLSKSSRYFEFYTAPEQTILQKMAESRAGYTKRETTNLLRLIYSEKLQLPGASNFNKTKYSELVRRANDIFE